MLIPRDDVVRLHDALRARERRVGQWQTASPTLRMPEVRVLPRRLWPKLKWTTRRAVNPEEAGSSPAGHPNAAGDLGSARSHTPHRRVRLPLPRLWAGGATGSAAPLQGEGCGFDSRTVHPADVAKLGEARRSDRRQCRFESDRQYHLDVAQFGERTGVGSWGLEVRVLPSRPNLRGNAVIARWWNWHHAWP